MHQRLQPYHPHSRAEQATGFLETMMEKLKRKHVRFLGYSSRIIHDLQLLHVECHQFNVTCKVTFCFSKWGIGAAARSQSCLSFNVAAAASRAPAFPDKQQTNDHSPAQDLPFLRYQRLPRTPATLHFRPSAIMEFGRAGVLNEGAVAASVQHSADRPLADLMDN